ncbi:MAG: DUF2235 domain-containing protein [Prochlorococcaceae cyanobacterium]
MAAKNLIVLSDGTWQDLSQPFPTNVVRLLEAITPQTSEGKDQLTYYDEGVGTQQINIEPNLIDTLIKIFGGALGLGMDHRILTCYRFLCLNYSPGDSIYLFGFSRGAYTVRSLAGLIYNCGLLRGEQVRMIPRAYEIYRKPNNDAACAPSGPTATAFRQAHAITDRPGGRPDITFIGIWDTVKALGIPEIPLLTWLSDSLNTKYKFHNEKLSPIIKAAYHAVSIEEQRTTFKLIPIDTVNSKNRDHLQQAWFPGGHGGVGGGDAAKAPLSDGALQWILDKLDESKCDLGYDIHRIQMDFKPNPLLPQAGKRRCRIITLITNSFGKQRRHIPDHTALQPSSSSTEVISDFALERLNGLKGWLPESLYEFLRRKDLSKQWENLVSDLQKAAARLLSLK